jgi:hypothetical protein
MKQYRYFTIPGCNGELWDPEVHGIERTPEECGTDDLAEICWEPGVYHFSSGCSGQGYTIHTPEGPSQTGPEQAVLKGFHAFLSELDFG